MNDGSWDLSEVDPATLERAVEEAARRGMSVEDYLTGAILGGARAPRATANPTAVVASETTPQDQAPQDTADGYAARHRLQALRRRLGSAADSLDGAIDALDGALDEISDRVGVVETQSSDTARTLTALDDGLAAVRQQVSRAQQTILDLRETNESAHADLAAACVGLGRRVDSAESLVRAASADAATAVRGQEALKRSLADDFAAFAHNTAAQLNAGLDEVRTAADAAAEQAEAAAAHVVQELRGVREALESRLADNTAETRARVQSAFAEAADRIAALTDRLTETERAHARAIEDTAGRTTALSERVAENERTNARAIEQLRAQVADMEDGAQSALEDTAETLRKADTALAANLARAQQEARDALGAVRAAFSDEVAELRQEHTVALSHAKSMDAALTAAADETAALRHALESRLEAAAAETQDRIGQTEEAWHSRFKTLAARFERQASEAEEARFALHADTERVEACTFAALEKLGADIAAGDATLDERLHQVARAAEDGVEQLTLRLDEESDVFRRLHAELTERLDLVTGAVSALNAEMRPTTQRLIRLERAEARAEAEQVAILALAERVDDLEQRQASSLDSLRADIAGFVSVNDRRLAALESGAASFDAQDMVERFADLRQRIEERIATVEQRSVRMLEQVAETVSLLDRRLGAPEQPASAKSA